MDCVVFGSSALVASSQRRISGSVASARAIAILCCCPPESAELSHLNENVICVVYNGADVAGTPLIAKMAIEENIAANILGAQTKCIGDKVYGSMILGIDGGEEQTERAVNYLKKTPNIIVRRDVVNA